jgi:hypothetical protein
MACRQDKPADLVNDRVDLHDNSVKSSNIIGVLFQTTCVARKESYLVQNLWRYSLFVLFDNCLINIGLDRHIKKLDRGSALLFFAVSMKEALYM